MELSKEILQAVETFLPNTDMADSAIVARDDALKCIERKDFIHAHQRLLTALAYCCGVFHPCYRKFEEMCKEKK